MNAVQVNKKSHEKPPCEGISIAQFLTVADIERSARYYEKVFGARVLSVGNGNAPAPNHINSFMNFRVADIQACYELWKSRGAEFITEPIPKYGEIAATFTILTVTLSRSDGALPSRTINAWGG